MKAGDRIRVDVGWYGMYEELQDFTVEELRYCLGIFLSEQHREAGRFTPLCGMYVQATILEVIYEESNKD